MKVVIESTPEIYQAPVNGVAVPVRVWRGRSEQGVDLDVYVLSIVPDNGQLEALKRELPVYMRPAREVMTINLGEEHE